VRIGWEEKGFGFDERMCGVTGGREFVLGRCYLEIIISERARMKATSSTHLSG
jgi:hypothetical protein